MNTIAGVDVSTFVRLMLDDSDSADYTFTDASLNALLAEAMRGYSASVPYIRESTFDIADGTAMYKMPSDCVRVNEVQYRVVETTDTMPEFLPELYWLDDEALAAVRNRLRQRYNANGDGAWEQITGLTSFTAGVFLVLYPTPTAADTVTYRYEAAHPLVSTDYPTVPVNHVEYLRDWVIALGKIAQSSLLRNQPFDYAAGQTRVRTGTHADALVQDGQAMLARVQQAVQRVTARWG